MLKYKMENKNKSAVSVTDLIPSAINPQTSETGNPQNKAPAMGIRIKIGGKDAFSLIKRTTIPIIII